MLAQHRITAAARRTWPASIAVAITATLAAVACAPATGHPGNTGASAADPAVPSAASRPEVTAGSATGRDPTTPGRPASGVAVPRPVSTVGSCAAQRRWGTGARGGGTAMTAAALYRVRAGGHSCYDRVVFDLNGPAAVGYTARYVPVVTADGSGAPVPVTGRAVLEVVVRAPVQGTDSQGHQPWVRPPAVGEDLVAPAKLASRTSLTQVAFAGSFEGQTTVAVGVRERRPFRVWISGEPHYRHVVLDIAH
jgi:hypothetical protein